RRTATRFTPGAICLRSTSHFPLKLYLKFIKPVVLPPGRARLSTNPAPTGSETVAKTIGRVRVAWVHKRPDRLRFETALVREIASPVQFESTGRSTGSVERRLAPTGLAISHTSPLTRLMYAVALAFVVRGAACAHISTLVPISITRFGGMRKNSVAARALRCMASNNLQRMVLRRDFRSGTIVTLPTKNDVSIMLS